MSESGKAEVAERGRWEERDTAHSAADPGSCGPAPVAGDCRRRPAL